MVQVGPPRQSVLCSNYLTAIGIIPCMWGTLTIYSHQPTITFSCLVHLLQNGHQMEQQLSVVRHEQSPAASSETPASHAVDPTMIVARPTNDSTCTLSAPPSLQDLVHAYRHPRASNYCELRDAYVRNQS